MGKVNWTRVLLCGATAGVLWAGVALFLFVLFGGSLPAKRPRFAGLMPVGMVLNVINGMWAMWLYAAIRPRYGAGPRTAAITGVAWWLIATVSSGNWANAGLLPFRSLVGFALACLPAMVAVTLLAASAYKEEIGTAPGP